jgi:cation:H+ antiporter
VSPGVLFVIGLCLLLFGGELLVRGASRLAAGLAISPLVVGLTVVAFATSAPELAVTLGSVAQGSSEIGVGNVVGSNISNVLLILGTSALVAPLAVSRQLIRVDVPLMVAASLIVYGLGWDGRISRFDGLVLAALLTGYLILNVIVARRTAADALPGEDEGHRRPATNTLLVVAGVAMLVVGADWLVDGAVSAARWLGLSELIVGLTIVAIGTSLPELATSVIATMRGEREIAVGNVVGSNIFNLLGVMGISASISPDGLPIPAPLLHFDLPVMAAAAVACLPVFFRGYQIARWEGALFLCYYVAYVVTLVLNASHHAALEYFSGAMLWFVIPLTVVTLGVMVVREIRAGSKPA